MDVQMKRGLLDVCVLSAIKNDDSYGYKIIKDLKPYIALSESTLYTILKRLETANMLTVRTAVDCESIIILPTWVWPSLRSTGVKRQPSVRYGSPTKCLSHRPTRAILR